VSKMIVNGFSNFFIIATLLIIVCSGSLKINCPTVRNMNTVTQLEICVPMKPMKDNNTRNNAEQSFDLLRNNIKVSSCVLRSSKCTDDINNISSTKTNITKQSLGTQCKYTVQVSTFADWTNRYNDTSAMEEWRVKSTHFNVTKLCNIYVYAIFEKPQCNIQEINITCFIKVFPEALCNFNITINDTDRVNGSVAYKHEQINGSKFYNTSCTFSPLMKPETGLLNVMVTMYPNITGNDSDIQYGTSNILQATTSSTTASSENESVLILASSIACGVLLIVVAVIMMLLWIKRKNGNFKEILSCMCSWCTSLHKDELYQKAEMDNTDIYSLNISEKDKSLDPYSVVQDFKLSDCRIYTSKIEMGKSYQKKNVNMDYANYKNATDSSDTHCKGKYAQPKSKIIDSELCSSPIKLKRYSVNDRQYTLVNKSVNETEKNIYFNGDISNSSSTSVSLITTINKLPTALKRVTFNESQYTLVDKFASKSIGTSEERLLHNIDIADYEDDYATTSSIFAQYK
ncbi:polymorphic transmembrane cluster 2 transmembrane protein 7, partial [Biomphalaria pfeifferi]